MMVRYLIVALVAAVAAIGAVTAGASGETIREVRVSTLDGPQTNPTITVDPRDDRILLAGSNSVFEGAQRIYSSTDGGATWRSSTTFPPPERIEDRCAADPGVAIDATGRQYYSFDIAAPCRPDGPYRVYVITRPDARAEWSKPLQVARLGGARLDDKPAIAVDAHRSSPHFGRVYVAWARLNRRAAFRIMLAHSDDQGQTWSKPVPVSRTAQEVNYATVAVSRTGLVYVAWTDGTNFGIRIARSTDGGASFSREHEVAAFTIVTIPHCGSGIVIPALPRGCLQAAPTVVVDTTTGRYSGRVYVSYTGTHFRGNQGTALTIFDPTLRPLSGYPIGHRNRIVAPPQPGRPADQFWPQPAIDHSNGTLWLCYYDTRGDPARKRARFSCTLSKDGGTSFKKPVAVATVPSDETQPGAIRQYGYYQGLTAANGVAHPIWTDTRDVPSHAEEIYAARVTEAAFRG